MNIEKGLISRSNRGSVDGKRRIHQSMYSLRFSGDACSSGPYASKSQNLQKAEPEARPPAVREVRWHIVRMYCLNRHASLRVGQTSSSVRPLTRPMMRNWPSEPPAPVSGTMRWICGTRIPIDSVTFIADTLSAGTRERQGDTYFATNEEESINEMVQFFVTVSKQLTFVELSTAPHYRP